MFFIDTLTQPNTRIRQTSSCYCRTSRNSIQFTSSMLKQFSETFVLLLVHETKIFRTFVRISCTWIVYKKKNSNEKQNNMKQWTLICCAKRKRLKFPKIFNEYFRNCERRIFLEKFFHRVFTFTKSKIEQWPLLKSWKHKNNYKRRQTVKHAKNVWS